MSLRLPDLRSSALRSALWAGHAQTSIATGRGRLTNASSFTPSATTLPACMTGRSAPQEAKHRLPVGPRQVSLLDPRGDALDVPGSVPEPIRARLAPVAAKLDPLDDHLRNVVLDRGLVAHGRADNGGNANPADNKNDPKL